MASSPPKPPNRGADGRLLPGGGSLNPEGRPSAARRFATLIEVETQEGKELARIALGVMRGKKTPPHVKLEAIKYLSAYWIGKAPQPITGEGGEGEVRVRSTVDAEAELVTLFSRLLQQQGGSKP